ncbi:MAG: hypothetical protein JWO09_218 [Bacteroidetes bacterium]|nr:hypothetical protein [Bacteroidota bacterium]
MQKLFHPKIIILLCITICVFVTTNIHWGKNKWQNILEADAKGYYAYLPAVFIYQDLHFGFYDSVEKGPDADPHFVSEYRVQVDGSKTINKYFCGTALAEAPFFLLAYTVSSISGANNTGFSQTYMLFITLAAIFYLWLGLWYTDKLLDLYRIRKGFRSICIIGILFGTNLFFYSVCEMGMSHIYSFAFMAMFCYFVKRAFMSGQGKHLFISLLLLGIIFLVRPANLMILLALPFLAGDLYSILTGINTIKKNPFWFLGGLISCLLIMSIQLIIYKIATGHFWVDSYPGEDFHFNDPHFFSILFSYKKGLFLYTPLYLLALGGIYFFFKKRKFEFFTFIFFFVALTYVLSSWWNWWYGGSFSSRVYVEYLPLFAVLLAFMLQHASKKIAQRVFVPLIFLLIVLCQFQTYQYRYYLIHWENMTQEKYWDVFLSMKK